MKMAASDPKRPSSSMTVPPHVRLLATFLALSAAAHTGLLALAGGMPWPRIFAQPDLSVQATLVVQDQYTPDAAGAALANVEAGGLPVVRSKAPRTNDAPVAPSTPAKPRASSGLAVVGTSTLAPVWSMVEAILPFWEAQYGGAPDPDAHPPELTGDVDLGYPAGTEFNADPARVEAVVLVGADGRAEHVLMTKGEAPFVNYAEAALRGVRFKPAEHDGRPVRHYLSLEVVFWPDPKAASTARLQAGR
jgi:hypothetical protein